MPQQRIRASFRKGERVRYISHLDVLRFWERAIRRADLPLSYSQGFTPHPRIAFAGPLPLGFVGEAEIMDVTLDDRVPVAEFRRRVDAETSEDLALVATEEVPLSAPSPQATLSLADYRVDGLDLPFGRAAAAIDQFLACRDFLWTEEKKDRIRTYNLREAVITLSAAPAEGGTMLTMRLRANQDLMGRPEQVLAAIFPGAAYGLITRTALLLDEPSPARDLWRRKGRFE